MGAPIGNTCPDINKAIGRLEPLIKQIDKLRESDYEDVKQMEDLLSECRYAMDSAIGSFEDLRKDNDTLRTWGKEMEESAETLQVQVNELTEECERLKEEIAEWSRF